MRLRDRGNSSEGLEVVSGEEVNEAEFNGAKLYDPFTNQSTCGQWSTSRREAGSCDKDLLVGKER
jgi:hypothetical protein